MISFELAQELKSAGFTQSTLPYAIYALNEHLRIRREHALQMWYGSKAKEGVALQLNEEAVYVPTLSDLVTACGKPLQLICDGGGKVAGIHTARQAMGRSGGNG
jgi:hypothetical protein